MLEPARNDCLGNIMNEYGWKYFFNPERSKRSRGDFLRRVWLDGALGNKKSNLKNLAHKWKCSKGVPHYKQRGKLIFTTREHRGFLCIPNVYNVGNTYSLDGNMGMLGTFPTMVTLGNLFPPTHIPCRVLTITVSPRFPRWLCRTILPVAATIRRDEL